MKTNINIELLKTRRSFAYYISWWFPIISVILVFILNGQQALVHLYNWWIVIIIPLLLALIILPLSHIDNNANLLLKKTVLIQGSKSWYAKMFVAMRLFLHSGVVLFVGALLIRILCHMLHFDIIDFNVYQCFLVISFIYLVNLWQIPILYMIANKLDLWGTIVYLIITNGVIGFSCSYAKLWIVIPWSYVYKIELFCLGILPNGLYDGVNTEYSVASITGMIFISVALSFLSFYLGERWYLSRK